MLNTKEMSQIWIPYLMFENGLDDENGFLSTEFGQSKVLVVIRDKKIGFQTKDSLDEGRLYVNQSMHYGSWFVRQFSCDFDLHTYPFDSQHCQIKVRTPWAFQDFIELAPGEAYNIGPDYFSQFNIINISMLPFDSKIKIGKSSTGMMFQIELQRDISHHIYMTYVPTLFILIMTLTSLFINEE